ncbi:MAG: SAM-dependent DNA methyltransferase [Gammaproteobacteria bacterium]|nr:SAM-dependent DNA methyltransferase [Gammaproteobacteria bacterium]
MATYNNMGMWYAFAVDRKRCQSADGKRLSALTQGTRMRRNTLEFQRAKTLPLSCTLPPSPPKDRLRISSRADLATPRRGHVLSTVSEAYGHPVRRAATALSVALSVEESKSVLHRCGLGPAGDPGAWIIRTPCDILAWSLVSIWLTGFAVGAISRGQGIRRAAAWFFSDPEAASIRGVSHKALADADEALASCDDPAAYLELLPYVLDPHGPGSRLSVRRDGQTRSARDAKRSHGVYYTPADVANYMVAETIRPLLQYSRPPEIYDPACGTAVFLRAAFAMLKAHWPNEPPFALSTNLYGTDIDPWAIQASTFILLADSLAADSPSQSPFDLWRRLRSNFACVDALRIDPSHQRTASIPQNAQNRLVLTQLFPNLRHAPRVIVGNPPYARLGSREDHTELSACFASLAHSPTPASEVFPLFVEQMVRLAAPPPATGTMVVPLSLASKAGRQFTALRTLIERTPGDWRFAFFDREPHALFGEDVKTRNSILLWERRPQQSKTTICTGPLRKWRAQDRPAMFSSIRFTPLPSSIRLGIPKLEGTSQAHAFDLLARRRDRFGHAYTTMNRVQLAQIPRYDDRTVFVAGTAYNFLNVFLGPREWTLPSGVPLSEHPLHAISFRTVEHARAGYALLSSRLAYWWWRVTQDGFHVTARFIADLPVGADLFTDAVRPSLSTNGHALWSLACEHPTVSVNGGKASVAFSPNRFDVERTRIDGLVATQLELEPAFDRELRSFVKTTITAATESSSPCAQEPERKDA